LIGDAKEKNIRKVATKLEQFREVFSKLFPHTKFNSDIPTNVIVFKDAGSYKPFKPRNSKWVAGYFQPGEDVNYITLSTDGKIEDTYGIIFHEYVHYLLETNFGKTDLPPWFNEGLAEYYQTFSIKEDKEVLLGGLQKNHLRLLQQNKLIPLKDFFAVDNYSLHKNSNHSRSVFYAQAWALIHYLLQGNGGVYKDDLNTFLSLVIKDTEPEKAFQQVFKMDYPAMEKILRKYAKQRVFKTSLVTFKNPLVFDTEMSVVPLSGADANAYLGDLLYHTHELDNAEIYLQKSLALNADQTLANNALGMVKMRQKKFAEAKKYLEKAVSGDQSNYLAHYNYAYILSREDMNEHGFVSEFPTAKAGIMRRSLRRAIQLKPTFSNSYRLLSFINFVNNENLDESIALLKKGLSIKPGDQQYLLQLAQIYMRQESFEEAEKIAGKLVKTAGDDYVRSNSESLLRNIKAMKEQRALIEKNRRENARTGTKNSYDSRSETEPSDDSRPKLVRRETLSKEDIQKIERDREIFGINRRLRKPVTGEEWILGYIQKIACVRGAVIFTVKTGDSIKTFTNKDFQSLELMAHTEVPENTQVGCDADLQKIHSVVTYQKENNAKTGTEGTILRIDFVPAFFELKTSAEIADRKEVYIIDKEVEERQKQALLRSMRESLRKVQPGEKRGVGIAERVECGDRQVIFHVKIGDQRLKLKTDSPQNVMIRGFTTQMEQIKLGCGAKFPPIKTVITYRPAEKNSDEGEAVALEFVPDDFEM
jgi:tetratricopeptide (TPR) repeat protein